MPRLAARRECDPSVTIAGTEELTAALPPQLGQLSRYPAAGHGVVRDAPEAIGDAIGFILRPSEQADAPV